MCTHATGKVRLIDRTTVTIRRLTPTDYDSVIRLATDLDERGASSLQALGRLAREEGQHRFVAEVLVEKHEMRRVIGDAGWPVAQRWDGAVIRLEVDLDRVSDDGSVESGTVQA